MSTKPIPPFTTIAAALSDAHQRARDRALRGLIPAASNHSTSDGSDLAKAMRLIERARTEIVWTPSGVEDQTVDLQLALDLLVAEHHRASEFARLVLLAQYRLKQRIDLLAEVKAAMEHTHHG